MTTVGWIGVDLDGTLAHYDGWQGETHIGAPIPAMVERVRRWRNEGREVRIFTARVHHNYDGRDVDKIRRIIEQWCADHLGFVPEITNEKDWGMIELWDDRAVSVEANTGRPLASSPRGLE